MTVTGGSWLMGSSLVASSSGEDDLMMEWACWNKEEGCINGRSDGGVVERMLGDDRELEIGISCNRTMAWWLQAMALGRRKDDGILVQ